MYGPVDNDNCYGYHASTAAERSRPESGPGVRKNSFRLPGQWRASTEEMHAKALAVQLFGDLGRRSRRRELAGGTG